MTKAIKNVSDGAWREFKALAGLKNMTLGEYFEEMIRVSKKADLGGTSWDKLFSIRITKEEAETAKKRIAEMRKGFVMRDVHNRHKHTD